MAVINLYSYQYDAMCKLHRGSILCGGVGSGKSRTSLARYYTLAGGKVNSIDKSSGEVLIKNTDKYIPMDHPPDLYIITTARKRDELEWEGELSTFLLSTNPERNYYKNKVIVDSWNNIKKYKNIERACFIFDEQRVVGYGAWSKSFIKIAHRNWWILLSATPGDNWEDYMSVFIANGFFKNKTEFENNHIVYKMVQNFKKIDRYLETGRLIRLRNKILVTMDFNRNTRSHHEDVLVNYDHLMVRWINKNKKNPFKQGYVPCDFPSEDSLVVGVDIPIEEVCPILEGWDYEPQIGDLVEKEYEPIKTASEFCSIIRKVVNTDESREKAVLEIIENHSKVIIFYNYDYELEILKNIFYGPDYEIAEWNGHKHQKIPESNNWVYLVQYTAGAEGWNCVKTDTIIFYSQNYSYKIMHQSAGRIDRLNTPFKDLYYYHIRSFAPIDIAIGRALECKKKFNESAFVRKIK